MKNKIEKFRFKLSWYEKIKDIDANSRGEILRKIMEYMFEDKIPKNFDSLVTKKMWNELFLELKKEKKYQESRLKYER